MSTPDGAIRAELSAVVDRAGHPETEAGGYFELALYDGNVGDYPALHSLPEVQRLKELGTTEVEITLNDGSWFVKAQMPASMPGIAEEHDPRMQYTSRDGGEAVDVRVQLVADGRVVAEFDDDFRLAKGLPEALLAARDRLIEVVSQAFTRREHPSA